MGGVVAGQETGLDILHQSRLEAIVCTRCLGVNALSIVRALGRLGVVVHVVSTDLPCNLASYSRYCATKISLDGLSSTVFSNQIRRVVDRCACPPLLYIDNDLMLYYFLESKVLREQVVFPGSIEIVRKLLDKKYQVMSAIEAGLDVPCSWFPESWNDISKLENPSGGRLIAKKRFPVESGRDGFKVLAADNGEQLCRELMNTQFHPSELFVQEYIPGRDDDVHFALSYQPLHTDGPAIVTGTKLIQSGSGDGGIMILGQASHNKTVRGLTERYIKQLGYWGYFGIEFKYDQETKKYFFIEVNTRPERCNALARVSGVDLDRISYLDATGDPEVVKAVGNIARPGVWLDGKKILETLRRQRKGGDFMHYIKSLPRKKEWAVWAWDDMKPFWRSLCLPKG